MARTIRQRRVQLGHSQAHAAEQAGVARRTWYEIELGHRRGSDGTLERMDRVLKLEPGTLRALDVAPASTDDGLAEERAAVFELILELTAEQVTDLRRHVLRMRVKAMQAELHALGDVAHERAPDRSA